METNFNLGSLKIVHAPLMEYFKQAQKNVSENLSLMRDEKKVPTNHEAVVVLSKVQKTLKMIGLTGLSTVLMLTEEALTSVKEVKFDTAKSIKLLELAEKILKNTSFYIESLVSSGVDQPTKFFDDYSALASVLGKQTSVKDLFNPRLEFRSGVNEMIQNDLRVGIFINENSKKNLISHLEKVHTNVQNRLVDVFKMLSNNGVFESNEEKSQYQNVCKQVYETFEYAQKLKLSKNFYILFGLQKLYICVLSPVFNEQFTAYVQAEQQTIKTNLAKSERVLSKLIQTVKEMDNGEKTGTLRADDETVKELVFELIRVIKSNPRLMEMPVYKELSSYFDLDFYSLQLVDTKIVFNNVIQNAETVQNIERLFTELKEDFTLLENKKNGTPEAFAQQLQKVISVNIKLNDALISVKEIQPLLAQVGAAFSLVKAKEIVLNEALERELSLALVLTEYGINNFVKNIVEEKHKQEYAKQTEVQSQRIKAVCEKNTEKLASLPLPVLDAASQKSDEKKAFAKIFEQLSIDLTKIEEVLDQYLRNDGENVSEIEGIFKPLLNMKGIFAVIGKSALGQAIDQIVNVWKSLVVQKDSVNKQEIDESIALISGLSLFVNAFKNDNDVEAEEVYENIIKRFHKFDVENHVVQISGLEEDLPTSQEPIVEEKIEPVVTEVIDQSFVQEEVNQSTTEELNLPEVKQEEVALTTEITVQPKEVEVKPLVQIFKETTNDPDLAEVFLMEAQEVLENMTVSIQALDKNVHDREELTNVRRYFHNLKGSGRMVGLEFLGEAGWMTEQTLNKSLSGEIPFDDKLFNAVKEMKSRFEGWVSDLQNHNEVIVDLVAVKELFSNINPHLTNHVEIHMPVKNEESYIENVLPVESESPEVPQEPVVDHVQVPELTLEPVSVEETNVNVEANFDSLPDVNDLLPSLHKEEDNSVVVQEISVPELELELPVVENISEEVVEAPALEVVDINVDAPQTLEEDFLNRERDTLIIEGHEVSSSLFSLFNEESSTHIAELKEFVHAAYSGEVFLNEDFMRHAHTLASIARTVHLSKIAQISSQLEDIANVALEKNLPLSQNDMNTLRHSVDNLDLFKNFEASSDLSYFDSLMERLNELYTKLIEVDLTVQENIVNAPELENEESNQEIAPLVEVVAEEIIPSVEAVATVEHEYEEEELMKISDILAQLSDSVKNTIDKNMGEIKQSIDGLQKEVEVLKNEPSQVSSQEMFDELMKNVSTTIDEQYKTLSKALAQEEEKNRQIVQQLVDKVDSLEETMKNIKESQAETEKVGQENIESVRKDIRILANIIKKKSELPYQELLLETNGQEVTPQTTEQSSVVSMDVNLSDIAQSAGVKEDEVVEDSSLQEIQQEVGLGVEDLSITSLESHEEAAELTVPEMEDIQINKELPLEVTSFETGQKDEISEKFEKMMKENHLNFGEVEVVFQENKPSVVAFSSSHDAEIASFLNSNEFVKSIFEEKISTVTDEIDTDIYEISKLEADEMLELISPLVESIGSTGLDDEKSQELKRYLHTFKGSVRMAGANKLGMLAHRLESLLDYAQSRNLNLYHIKPLLEKEIEKINFLIKDPTQSLDANKLAWLDEAVTLVNDPKTIDSQISEVKDLLGEDKASSLKKEQRQYIRIVSNVIDSIINEAGEIRLTRTALEGVVQNNKKALTDLRNSSSKLLKMSKEIEIQAESQIQARRDQLEEHGEDFDPLEFDRFTRLQELTRFMNEAVADVQDTVNSLDNISKLQDNTVSQQSILTNNLLDVLMKVRLVPMDTISERLYKITRNTAKELDKKVVLELLGEKTEIDRLVLDKVTSPLEHLLRNCIAHGIESSQERLSKGKSATGKVVVETMLEGKFIIIKVSDDGAGINVEKVKQIGINKGLISAGGNYSKDEIINLIFQSGFSTADTVSQVAGRGVGMDVVKNEITALGGSVSIKTEKDKGSIFTLTLPVAVATNQAMLCDVMGKLVAIPALLVTEVTSVKQNVLEKAYANKSIEIKGEKYPFFYVGHLLGLLDTNQLPEMKTYNNLIAVKYLEESIVVHVDKLMTTNEILVKSLGSILGKISGLLGATLLGDGQQGVVINPVLLKNHYQNYLVSVHDSDNRDKIIEERKSTITVMVVDDSITVRRATSKVLECYNYNIILAKDGEDALEQLQITIPDIILSDIEMPRMDGFEFAKNVRSIDKYSNIPIIMITSRTAEKHKNLAFEIGANDFLGKPYREEELIEKIKFLIK